MWLHVLNRLQLQSQSLAVKHRLHVCKRPGGESVRKMVRSLMMDIQRKLVQDRSDDVESFTEMLAIYDAALFCHGRDEEEVSDHVEEHKRGKADQRDQLVRGKHHLARCSLRQCDIISRVFSL